MLFLPFSYIRYLIRAKRRHGTHSPFVYELVERCLSAKVDKNFDSSVKKLAKKLASDRSRITVTDHGAGSRVSKSKTRRISSLYRHASSGKKYGKLLYQLSTYYRPKRILEFGTSLGMGTISLHAGREDVQVSTVEACSQTLLQAIRNFEELQLDHITTFHSTFNELLATGRHVKYDLIFVDGHHSGEALLKYMDQLEALSHDETLFVLDDIRWSRDMYAAWQELISAEKYHVSIDLFRMGVLVKRPHQAKEHFTIRM